MYVGLNIEHFLPGTPSTSIWPGTADLTPDPLNHGWRDYGARVGIWRTIDALGRHGMRARALLNSTVAEQYPRIVGRVSRGTGPGSRTARRTRSCTPGWRRRKSARS